MMSPATKTSRIASLLARWADQSDEQLLLAYRSDGVVGAFEALVHRYEQELYSYLNRYLGDAAMAEDAFQATFLQLHLKRDRFEEGRKVRPWLYTIATNQAIDARRRNKRHRLLSLSQRAGAGNSEEAGSLAEMLLGREPQAAANLEQDERREWVRRAVAELPDQFRRAVILVYNQGLKYREAAEVLGIPVGTVKSRLHTALAKLNELWNQTHRLEHD